MKSSFFTMVSLALVSQCSFALELVSSDDIFAEIPMVTSATQMKQSIDTAPASITIIDRAMIEASTAVNLVDLLTLVPGFQVSYASGNIHVASYHGFSDEWNRRMEVLIDGRSVYLPMLSTVDWASLPISLQDIERVEVIRGSNVPLFGSNAFMGVVNIITRKVPALNETSVSSLMALPDANDPHAPQQAVYRNDRLSVSRTIGRGDLQLSYANNHDNGIDVLRDRSYYDKWYLHYRLPMSPNTNLSMSMGLSKGNAGMLANGREYERYRDKKVNRNYQSLTLSQMKAAGTEWRLNLYHNYYHVDDSYLANIDKVFSDALTDIYETPVDIASARAFISANYGGVQSPDQQILMGGSQGIAERYDLDVQVIAWSANKVRFSGGLGTRQDSLSSKLLLKDDAVYYERQQRVFANLEYKPVPALVFNAGAMYVHVASAKDAFSPRLSTSYRIDRARSVRLIASRAYRIPSLLEKNIYRAHRFSDGTIIDPHVIFDPNVRNERLDSLELAFMLREGRQYAEFKLFGERYRDFVIEGLDQQYAGEPFPAANDGEVWVWSNGGQIDTYGLESLFRFQLGPAVTLDWQGTLQRAEGRYLRWINSDQPPYRDIGNSGGRDSASPEFVSSALLHLKLPHRSFVSVAWTYNSAMKWFGVGGSMKEYSRLDYKVSSTQKLAGHRFSFSLLAQNVMGNYYSFRKQNEMDKRVFVGLEWQY